MFSKHALQSLRLVSSGQQAKICGKRSFASSRCHYAQRAVIFTDNGTPSQVLRVQTFPTLPPPPSGCVNIRFRLSPINPADVNVVEGKYPAKPGPSHLSDSDKSVFIGGNEGLAEVIEVGSGIQSLKKGDWVVMKKRQFGTWCTSSVAKVEDLLKLPKVISEVHAATITVNPPTALCMLEDFVDLEPGDWVIQNAANSAVGQSVIQIASSRGLKTLNFVRHREDFAAVKQSLVELGATEVFTYDDAQDKSKFQHIKQLVSAKGPRLLLNATCDSSLSRLASLLTLSGREGHLVTYGAMAKQPLSLPAGLFIFGKLTCHGFWMSGWPEEKGRDRKELLNEIVALVASGKLREPEHEIVTIRADMDDESAGQEIRSVFEKLSRGQSRKVLLKIEETE